MNFGAALQIGGLLMLYPFTSLTIIDISLAIVAIGNTFSFFPILSELIEKGKEITPDANIELLSDLCSGVYNAAFDFSEFLGPFTGGILNYYFEFNGSCFIISLACAFVVIIYLIFGNGYQMFNICKPHVLRQKQQQKNVLIQIQQFENQALLHD